MTGRAEGCLARVRLVGRQGVAQSGDYGRVCQRVQ